MVFQNLAGIHIVLASKSPRRHALLSEMGLTFTVRTKEVDESFPPHLPPKEAVRFIAESKAKAFMHDLTTDELLIVADTIVSLDNDIIGKPGNVQEAISILTRLSGRKHEVHTAVSLVYKGKIESIQEQTDVYFKHLSDSEITHYVDHYQPLDKAGAYGIQEWIGAIGVEKIVGSYTNVMGLPTSLLYSSLSRF